MDVKEIIAKLADLDVFVQDNDVMVYHKYLSKLPLASGVMDIGTGWGKSVMAMAMSAPHLIIDSIDNGDFPIASSWAKDQDDYAYKLLKRFQDYGVGNIRFELRDATLGPRKNENYDLIHLDFTIPDEQETYKKWFEVLNPGGIFLVRNFSRFAEGILPEPLEVSGLIMVVQK